MSIIKKVSEAKNTTAADIQKKLYEMGFRYLTLCDSKQKGLITESYWWLSQEIDEDPDPANCGMFDTVELLSQTALVLIEQSLTKTTICPDYNFLFKDKSVHEINLSTSKNNIQ
jgi:hypothetical protein